MIRFLTASIVAFAAVMLQPTCQAEIVALMPCAQSVVVNRTDRQAYQATTGQVVVNGVTYTIHITGYNMQMTSPPPYDPNLHAHVDPVTGQWVDCPWGQNGYGFPQLLEDGSPLLRF